MSALFEFALEQDACHSSIQRIRSGTLRASSLAGLDSFVFVELTRHRSRRAPSSRPEWRAVRIRMAHVLLSFRRIGLRWRVGIGLLALPGIGGFVAAKTTNKHFAEKGTVERYKVIDRFAELIYKITSDNGAHIPYEHPKYPPTRYTVQAVTFALLDLLLWFGMLMAEHDGQRAK